jgi:hypothetical protein
VAKTGSVVAGMLAGADSIDDLDLLRHGGMGRLFDGVRAPSTLGTYLRSFTHGHVQQLDAVSSRLLAGLAARVPGLLAGGDQVAFVDVDDTIREVQAATFGYSGVRGLNVQLAVVSTPLVAPVIASASLRRGNVASAAGVGRLLAQAINTARGAGATGQIMARAEVVAAISRIEESAWTPISYPHAIWEAEDQRWVSDAEVAEIDFTAFTSRRKTEHVACRLVVRRVKRLNPTAGPSDDTVQGELFAAHRHHAFITNSTLATIEADARHRDHAIVEQVIAELKDGPIAHLPSSSLHGQRCLARSRGDRIQPRPHRWRAGLPAARPSTLGHHPDPPDQRARPNCVLGTKTHLAPTTGLALGRGLEHARRARHGATRTGHRLTTPPNGHDQGTQWTSRTDRRTNRAHPQWPSRKR